MHLPSHRVTLLLLTVAGAALQGCIAVPLPEFPKTPKGQSIHFLVGDQGSSNPIKLGVTTRESVVQQLGEPRWRTEQDTAIGYEYLVNSILWIDPLVYDQPGAIFPFHPPFTPSSYFLLLGFDGSGILERYIIQRRFGHGAKVDTDWIQFTGQPLHRPKTATQPATTSPCP